MKTKEATVTNKFDHHSSRWSRRTRVERKLLVLGVFSNLVAFVLYVGLLDGSPVDKQPCTTAGCVRSAGAILEHVDPKVNPCDDFYQFSCGKWLNGHQVTRYGDGSVTHYKTYQDEVYKRMRILVKKVMGTPVSSSDPEFVAKMKNFYQSCLNVTKIDEIGDKPLKDVIKAIGGWPVLEGDSWNEDKKFNWLDMMIAIRRHGYVPNFLMSVNVLPDDKNTSKRVLHLDKSTFGLSKFHLFRGLKDEKVKSYYGWMVKTALLLGADRNNAKREMMDVLDFETSLATVKKRSVTFSNTLTIGQLAKKTEKVDWMKLFNGILGFTVTEDELVIVNNPSFILHVNNLLAVTPSRTIANYLIWRGVIYLTNWDMSPQWRQLNEDWHRVLHGIDHWSIPRRAICRRELLWAWNIHTFDVGLAALYARNYAIDQESEKVASNIFSYVKKGFADTIYKLDWMDNKTKEVAIEKANAAKAQIGYPTELLNDALVSGLYKTVDISPVGHFHNLRNLTKWVTDNRYSKLKEPIKRDWKDDAYRSLYVHSFDDRQEDKIQFDDNSFDVSAHLQAPLFFDKERPAYLNFGHYGWTLASKVIHGFDYVGRLYDKDGNNVGNWWHGDTLSNYKNKERCIIDQYNNFTIEEIDEKVNGVKTKRENMASVGGWKESYFAYNTWVKGHGPEKSLPGLSYTPNQLFWLSGAIGECSVYRNDMLVKFALGYYDWPPSRFRVNGAVMNIPEFGVDWKCPLGSPMNPAKKCHVW